jgi:septum site-determining protein MinD
MVEVCNHLRPSVDFILIDSPAGIEQGFRNAVAPSNRVIIVTTPEVSAVRDADRIVGLIEADGKGPARLIINRLDVEMVRRGQMLSREDVIEILAIELLGVVPEDKEVIISTNQGVPVALNGRALSGQAFRNISGRMLGEDIPLLNLESKGVLDRLTRIIRR